MIDGTTRERSLREELEARRGGVWLFLRMLGCDPEEADDLAQETLLRAFREARSLRDPAALPAWLRATARRLLVSRRRSAARHREILDLEAAEAVWRRRVPDDRPDRFLEALRDCVEGLEGRARAVVDGFYGEGRRAREVAERIGLSETNVESILSRTRALLRRCIEKEVER